MNDSNRICELCCGAGGMAAGFSPYFEIVQAVDISKTVVKTYGANHPETSTRRQDIQNLTGCKGDFEGITGVIGGPPCQGSSIINTKRCSEDPRNGLINEFMRLVSEIKPRFFVMENVPGVPKEIKESVIRTGTEADYCVSSTYLNAADYGAAQTRKRWIVVGMKGRQWVTPRKRTHSTVRQAFSQIHKNWGLMQSRPETLDRLKMANNEWTGMSGGFRNMIKLSWDNPAPAVVNLKKVYMVHPDECRNISLAEAAALQGFPSDYQWYGNESEIAQMIANAMPAQLAESIAGVLA